MSGHQAVPTGPVAPALPADASAIGALLAAAGLPHRDIAPHLANFLVLRDGAALAGAVGLEITRPDALLRSLVVAPSFQHHGIGRALVRAAAAHARDRGVTRLFLLTTTAARFFERLGFAVTDRAEAPPAVAASGQFQGVCPASAVCLSARVADLVAP